MLQKTPPTQPKTEYFVCRVHIIKDTLFGSGFLTHVRDRNVHLGLFADPQHQSEKLNVVTTL